MGQLTSASGHWGTGSYKYDSLGNIRQKILGSRTVNMSYNGLNLLTSYTDTAGPNKTLSYDPRGNVTALGTQCFQYDMADQPTLALDTEAGSYQYDGNLKRVTPLEVSFAGKGYLCSERSVTLSNTEMSLL